MTPPTTTATTSRAARKNRERRKRARLAPPPSSPAPTRARGDDGGRGDESVAGTRARDDASDDATVERVVEREEDGRGDAMIERVERVGAYGAYGSTSGRMSAEDDEWATATRTWASLFRVLDANGYKGKKIWAPFVYDELAGRRMREAGFERVVHKRWDFFARVRDAPFVKSLDCVVDNPPYTGKNVKERILRALVDVDVPFCLLLPLGVLHGAFVRDILEEKHVQVIIPRKCYVFKKGGTEVPFRYLCWLCYKMNLERDLYLIE